jgi:hypothetical protein
MNINRPCGASDLYARLKLAQLGVSRADTARILELSEALDAGEIAKQVGRSARAVRLVLRTQGRPRPRSRLLLRGGSNP